MTQRQSVPFIPDNAPFTPSQRAWLNGFLAGMFCQTTAPAGTEQHSAAKPKPERFSRLAERERRVARQTLRQRGEETWLRGGSRGTRQGYACNAGPGKMRAGNHQHLG